MKKGMAFAVAITLFSALLMANGIALGAPAGMPAVSLKPDYTFPPTTIDQTKTVPVDSTVSISDSNLKAKLQGVLGLSAQTALRKSDLAKITGGLDLSSASITKLEGLQHCVNVTDLKLSDNKIQDSGVPSALSALTNLKTLLLDGNKLTKVPAAVLSMRGLTYLSLAGNGLKSVVDNIDVLSELVNLDLSNNGSSLTKLPVNIGKLQKLQFLSISGNNFRDAQRELFLLPSLKTLDLSNNWLGTLPDDVVRMPNLVTLNVGSNILSALPAGLGNAPNLQKVYAACNRLTAIELTLLNGKITDLELDVNRMTELPPELTNRTFSTFSVEWNFIDMSEGSASRQIADSVNAPAGKAYLRQLRYITDPQYTATTSTVKIKWQPLLPLSGSDGDVSWKVSKYQIYKEDDHGSWGTKAPDAELDGLADEFVVTGLDSHKAYKFHIGVEYSITFAGKSYTHRYFTEMDATTLDANATLAPTEPPTSPPEETATSPDPSAAMDPSRTDAPAPAPGKGSSGALVIVIIVCALIALGLIAFVAMRMARRNQRY
jgi:Leucine-rich repeat (LRR) protein